jgi:hypothetical protein
MIWRFHGDYMQWGLLGHSATWTWNLYPQFISTMQNTQKHLTAFLHTCKGISTLWIWYLASYFTGCTNTFSTSQEILHTLWQHFHKNPPTATVLASFIQKMPSHPISVTSILRSLSHPYTGPQTCLFLQGDPANPCMCLSHACHMYCYSG